MNYGLTWQLLHILVVIIHWVVKCVIQLEGTILAFQWTGAIGQFIGKPVLWWHCVLSSRGATWLELLPATLWHNTRAVFCIEYKNMDMTKERNSLIFEQRSMFLSSQMILSFVSAAMVWAILERTSRMDPSSVTMAPKYLKLWTVSSFSPLTLMLLLMPLVLLVINLVFSALICMPYAVEVWSRRSTRLANSTSKPVRPSMSSAERLG